MTSLKAEPAGRVRSMSEFFALARSMEADAAERYTETARQLSQQGNNALADVFNDLAKTELGHVQEVEQWATEDQDTDNLSETPWPIPDTFDAPPEEMARSQLMTPYRALASAVRHEERSFAFWTYVAAHADREDVKAAAERMALEELEHVSLLRRERRKAFHAEQRVSGAGEGMITLSSLAATERQLADLIERQPQCVALGSAFAASIAEASRQAASTLESLDSKSHSKLCEPSLAAARRDDIASIAEFLVEAYLRLAETSEEESVLGTAQELAKNAIYRLGMLQPEFQPKMDEPS